MVMLMLTQAVAVHGRVAMVLLDVAAAFDEVSQHAILRAAHQIDPTSWGIILQMLDVYTEIRTFVVTAYGLSEWYAQLGGVMQGGGLDPLMYIFATLWFHKAMQFEGHGIPIWLADVRQVVGSLSFVDDTSLFGLGADDMQLTCDRARCILTALGQRCNADKFEALFITVKDSVLQVERPIMHWEGVAIKMARANKYVRLLGGNANILGGHVDTLRVVRKWAKLVHAKLYTWPVSVHVARAVINGLVTNRMIYRSVVNIPPEVVCDAMVGTISRTYRSTFGLPPRTPRTAVYEVVQDDPPDAKLWVTVIIELSKALNSTNHLLRMALWEHWLQPSLHRLDLDMNRIKDRLRAMNITLVSVQRDSGVGQGLTIDSSCPPQGALYVFGDASLRSTGGGAVQVRDAKGRVYITMVVHMSAQGLSTKIVEATMIISGIMAVDTWLGRLGLSDWEVWCWSDCVLAVQSARSGEIQDMGMSIAHRLVIRANTTKHSRVHWGWCPAQHDSGADDWISLANREMDALARKGAEGAGLLWTAPEAWLDYTTVFPVQAGRLVLNVKSLLYSEGKSHVRCWSHHSRMISQRTWSRVQPESVEANRQWAEVQPLNIKEWGFMRSWTSYPEVEAWEVDKLDMPCGECGLWCPSVRVHQLHECLRTKLRVLAWVREVMSLGTESVFSRQRLCPRWGGLTVAGKPSLHIVWSHPSRVAAVHGMVSPSDKVWAVWPGAGLPKGIVTVLACLGMPQPHQFMFQLLALLHSVTYGNETVQLGPCPYIRHPSDWVPGANTQLAVGSAPAYETSQQVPLWLIWALVSATRPSSLSPVAHVLGHQPLVTVALWRRTAPDVWVGTCAGAEGPLVEEALHRRSQGRTVYWVLVGQMVQWEGVKVQGDLECMQLCVPGVLPIMLLSTDHHRVKGVPPEFLVSAPSCLQAA